MTETEKRHDAEAEDALHSELKDLRKYKDSMEKFLRDAAAYMDYARAAGQQHSLTITVLAHDIKGLANHERCFLPRVTGYEESLKSLKRDWL